VYISLSDIRNYILEDEKTSENPGIFIEYMGQCYEPEDVVVDDDGDIIIRI
jgi:hypothetical protein